ncbi:MAG: helix-turn-helix transcriptional regulator [Silvibacterium sp.]|nr:helix-turn-helix transcriptional regulator [Silvibacterium sp.]
MSSRISQNFSEIDWKAVGRRIRELRGFDTKQSDLAKAVGVGQSHISAIEKGKREIGGALLYRLAKHYGKTMEWLLTGIDGEIR